MLATASLISAESSLAPPGNCRVHQRQACGLTTTCKPASLLSMKEKELCWTATISDISLGGVRLHLERRFEKGTPLAIELPGDHGDDPSVVFVKVVHLQRQDDASWILGCKFVSELAEDELQRLTTLQQNAQEAELPDAAEEVIDSSIIEQAVSENKFLSNVHFQIKIRQGSQIHCVFKRFDVSKSWPLIPGKIVRLSGGASGRTEWSLKVQLVQCSQEESRWMLQAQLLRTPKLSELLRALGSA